MIRWVINAECYRVTLSVYNKGSQKQLTYCCYFGVVTIYVNDLLLPINRNTALLFPYGNCCITNLISEKSVDKTCDSFFSLMFD